MHSSILRTMMESFVLVMILCSVVLCIFENIHIIRLILLMC